MGYHACVALAANEDGYRCMASTTFPGLREAALSGVWATMHDGPSRVCDPGQISALTTLAKVNENSQVACATGRICRPLTDACDDYLDGWLVIESLALTFWLGPHRPCCRQDSRHCYPDCYAAAARASTNSIARFSRSIVLSRPSSSRVTSMGGETGPPDTATRTG